MDDTAHVEFSRRLGDLDNIKRFVKGDRKLRYAYYELFDAGNIDSDGRIVDPDSATAHASKVRTIVSLTSLVSDHQHMGKELTEPRET